VVVAVVVVVVVVVAVAVVVVVVVVVVVAAAAAVVLVYETVTCCVWCTKDAAHSAQPQWDHQATLFARSFTQQASPSQMSTVRVRADRTSVHVHTDQGAHINVLTFDTPWLSDALDGHCCVVIERVHRRDHHPVCPRRKKLRLDVPLGKPERVCGCRRAIPL
jgi:hypothetical protein